MLIELEYLTNDLKNQLICQKYWELNQYGVFVYSASDLADNYKINTSELYRIIRESCIVHLSGAICPSCGVTHTCRNRTDFNKLIRKSNILCQRCEKKQQQEEKQRQEEIERKKRQEIQEKEKIQRQYLIDNFQRLIQHPFNFHSITPKYLILLLALIRFSADEELLYLQSYSSIHGVSLTPNHDFSMRLLSRLFDENIITPSPHSSLSCFIWEENNSYNRFYLTTVEWLINHNLPILSIQNEIERIIYSDGFLEDNIEDIWELCNEIALEECLAYLSSQITQRHFEFSAGEKTKAVLSEVLQEYSVSQVYNFIYTACRYAADEYQKRTISKKHAANLIPGSIQRYAERAKADGWEIKPYRRNFDLPQSELSVLLFDSIFEEADGGFHKTTKELFDKITSTEHKQK